MKLSIIIPAYNVEVYIEKCLRSCIEQNISPEKYEIIVINDGSKDRTLDIISELMEEHKNIKVFSQRNLGLAATRNRGLDIAKGEYVWFVDSDDYIENNCLKNICDKLHNIDILVLGYKEIKGNEVRYFRYAEKETRNGNDLLNCDILMPVQLYIFNRYFLKKYSLTFSIGIFHEDFEFTPRMLYYAKKMEFYDEFVYNKLIRSNSITAVFNPKRSYDMLIIANNLVQFFNKIQNIKKSKYSNLVSLAINNALYIITKSDIEEKERFLKVIFENRYLFKIMCKSNKIKYKMEGFLFKCFPRSCCTMYKIIKGL